MEAEKKQRHRAASEQWKRSNYDYYLMQKRILSSRPEYKAHRRAKYHEKMQALRMKEDYVPPVRGRPRIYNPEEAAKRRRETARSWAVQKRRKQNISVKEIDQHHDYTREASD